MSDTTIYLVRLKNDYRPPWHSSWDMPVGMTEKRPSHRTALLFQHREDAEQYCQTTLPPATIFPFHRADCYNRAWQQRFLELLADHNMPPMLQNSSGYFLHYFLFDSSDLDIWWNQFGPSLTTEQFAAIWHFIAPRPYEMAALPYSWETDTADRWPTDAEGIRQTYQQLLESRERLRQNAFRDHYYRSESEIPTDENSEDFLSVTDAPLPLSLQMGEEWR